VQKISMSKNINGQITGDMDESCRWKKNVNRVLWRSLKERICKT
jgi:hypothetical protein